MQGQFVLEPLFLQPHYESPVWGGSRLRELYGKDFSGTVGESWEISAHKKGESRIRGGALDGRTLSEAVSLLGERLLGTALEKFALLVKLLDAREALSVQVHPDDAYAAAHENSLGKTEAWVVLEAQPGAELVYGIDCPRAEFWAAVEAGELERHLLRLPVQAGDVLYIPAGTVHAIGAGLVLYEIQQSSDVTYRVYDWGRLPARELHTAKALDCITDGPPQRGKLAGEAVPIPGGSCVRYFRERYFSLDRITPAPCAQLETSGARYHAYTALGAGRVRWANGERDYAAGESFLIPAALGAYSVEGGALLRGEQVR